MEDVDEKYVLSDGTRNLDIYYVQGLPHVEGMLMAFLPKEKIVIEADLYDPSGSNSSAPTAPSAVHRVFYNNVQQLGLDISTIAPIHGSAVPWSDFLKVIGKAE
jgi:hypothetical protein